MSSVQIDLGPNPAEYIWINTLINLSATVMLYYEYMLTLSREIQFLWPPHNKLGWFTFSCLLNRYLPLFGHIPIFLPYLITASSDFCEGLHVYDEWFVLGVQAQANLLVLLRVYALYDRSRRILGVLMLLGVVDFITAVSTLFVSRHGGNVIPVTSSFPGCSQYMPPLGGRFAAIPWMGVLIYDCGVFCLTLYKAVTMGRGIKLLNVIVRDGTMYFSALFVINLVNILTLWFAPVRYYAFQCRCSSLTSSHYCSPN
ncbi:hypothetical protein BJV74DRAFT_871073 [Russula compacta]|nr:hypothetical protein BJV74DRAFT_871073 [Russula compacta]